MNLTALVPQMMPCLNQFISGLQYVDNGRIKMYVNTNQWVILNYNKQLFSDPATGFLRSVVFNADKKMVCFSPPKSLKVENQTFETEYIFEEHLEGTMINLFWSDGWEISTKSVIGGTNGVNINGNVSFRKMFDDLFHQSNISYDDLNKEYSYSFLLQHINNRIVIPVERSRLVLIAVYRIENTESSEIIVHVIDKRKYHHDFLIKSNIELPRQYSWEEFQQLQTDLSLGKCPYTFVGFSIHNTKTHERYKITNKGYNIHKYFRGNDYNMMYRYMRHAKHNTIDEYLNCFPEDQRMFQYYQEQMDRLLKLIYDLYFTHYIKKQKTICDFPNLFYSHLKQLHFHYYAYLKPHGQRVTFAYIKWFVHQLSLKQSCDLLSSCIHFNHV